MNDANPKAKDDYRAFLTGSRVYSIPRDDSDIDLVVLMDSRESLDKLIELSDNPKETRSIDDDYCTKNNTYSLRFGKLNLLCCLTPWAFRTFARGTKDLLKKAPVTRDEAVEHFIKLRGEGKVF